MRVGVSMADTFIPANFEGGYRGGRLDVDRFSGSPGVDNGLSRSLGSGNSVI